MKRFTEGIPSVGGEHLRYDGSFDFTNVRYVPRDFYETMTKGQIRKGDVLVVKDGATTGKTAFVLPGFPFEEAAVNEHVFILRAERECIDPKYLFFWMHSPYGRACIRDNFKGTAQGGINTSFAKNSNFPLPPLAEQDRMVTKIEELFTKMDAGVRSLESAKDRLAAYRRSVLSAAAEGKLTREWRERHKGQREPASELLRQILNERREKWEVEQHEKMKGKGKTLGGDAWKKKYQEPPGADTSGLPRLPDEWVWTLINQLLTEPLSNGRSVKTRKGGFPVLRLTAIRDGQVDLAGFKEGAWTKNDASPYLVERGDFLVARGSGSLRLVGLGGVVGEVAFPIAYPDTMIRLRLNWERIDPRFFREVWNGELLRRQIERSARTTAGIYKINQGHIRNFAIPLPPLNEQYVIAEDLNRYLSLSDSLSESLENAMKQAERLRQSILREAFAGRLVPQESSEVPASVLLEMIKRRRGGRRSRNFEARATQAQIDSFQRS